MSLRQATDHVLVSQVRNRALQGDGANLRRVESPPSMNQYDSIQIPKHVLPGRCCQTRAGARDGAKCAPIQDRGLSGRWKVVVLSRTEQPIGKYAQPGNRCQGRVCAECSLRRANSKQKPDREGRMAKKGKLRKLPADASCFRSPSRAAFLGAHCDFAFSRVHAASGSRTHWLRSHPPPTLRSCPFSRPARPQGKATYYAVRRA